MAKINMTIDQAKAIIVSISSSMYDRSSLTTVLAQDADGNWLPAKQRQAIIWRPLESLAEQLDQAFPAIRADARLIDALCGAVSNEYVDRTGLQQLHLEPIPSSSRGDLILATRSDRRSGIGATVEDDEA